MDAGLVRELAAHCEQLGYHSLWSNDEPTARGLDTIAELSGATAKIELGVGVLPLRRYQPAQIGRR
jgi:alkanesulfonate monooxygenase SsuD/methylene tetrahydromethanopterin reductase-like flavin-dependent oxidoreductase (luciferase family)